MCRSALLPRQRQTALRRAGRKATDPWVSRVVLFGRIVICSRIAGLPRETSAVSCSLANAKACQTKVGDEAATNLGSIHVESAH